MRFSLIIIASILSCLACAPKELAKYYGFGQPFCETTLEGSIMVSDKFPETEFGILGVKEIGNKTESIAGQIIEISDDGILFDQKRRSIAYDPKETFYEYSDLDYAIDSEGNTIYGDPSEINKRLSNSIITNEFRFFIEDRNTNTKSYFKAINGESFSYCIEPGIYKIVEIERVRKNKDSDFTKNILHNEFDIQADRTNYLGVFLINADSIGLPSFSFPLHVKNRPNKAAALSSFGALGGLIYGLSTDSGVIDSIEIQIIYDPEFEPLNTNEVFISRINFIQN